MRKPSMCLTANRAAVLAVACISVCASASPDAPPIPVGFYYMEAGRMLPAPSAIMPDYIDGIAMRTDWAELETGPGEFDFSSIDARINLLASMDKKLTLVAFNRVVPEHILATVPVEEQYLIVAGQGQDALTAVTWSETALLAYEVFCEELGNHEIFDPNVGADIPLREHSALAQINTGILGLGSIRDKEGRLVAHPQWDRATFTAGMLRSTHAMQDQFQSKHTYLGIFGMSDAQPGLRDALVDALLTEFDGTANPKLGFFQENLACEMPGIANNVLYQNQDDTFTMYQMLQSWVMPHRPGNEPKTDVCLVTTVPGDRSTAISGPEVAIQLAFENIGTRYFEIYAPDLNHPGFADEFLAWHDILHDSVSCVADCDGNTVLNILDYICFGDAFAAGCP